MNVLALFVALPLLIVATLFLLAIAYMQSLILKQDHDYETCKRVTSAKKP